MLNSSVQNVEQRTIPWWCCTRIIPGTKDWRLIRYPLSSTLELRNFQTQAKKAALEEMADRLTDPRPPSDEETERLLADHK